MALEKTWRWFGPNDNIQLHGLRQMGVEGVVTSLHHIASGQVWPIEDIFEMKESIEQAGLTWSVVESLPVHEGIKTHSNKYDQLVSNYCQSLENLGKCGLDTICYNFMPVLDWARTDLQFKLASGGEVMYFDFNVFAAFDIFILKRPGAKLDYTQEVIDRAEKIFKNMSEQEASALAYNIIVYTQGFIHGSIDKNEQDYKSVFLNLLSNYAQIDPDTLRNNLGSFLSDVLPTAEKFGIKMCIHPDDPPFPLLGLPRIVSTKEDLEWIFGQNPSPSNGFTFCSGSLSARKDNNLEDILIAFAAKVHFVHLRNNIVNNDGSFHESGHIDGNVNLPALIKVLLLEQERRKQHNEKSWRLPVRPDHGIKMLDDFNLEAPPGYPLIGRFKGLMEIKGIEAGLNYILNKN